MNMKEAVDVLGNRIEAGDIIGYALRCGNVAVQAVYKVVEVTPQGQLKAKPNTYGSPYGGSPTTLDDSMSQRLSKLGVPENRAVIIKKWSD